MNIQSPIICYQSRILKFSTACVAVLGLSLATQISEAARSEDPLFDVFVMRDISGPLPSEGGASRDGRIVVNFHAGNTLMNLDFFDTLFGGDGEACFGDPAHGVLIMEPNDDDNSRAVLRFVTFGYTSDGNTEVTYQIDLDGEFLDGWFRITKKEGVVKTRPAGGSLAVGDALYAHFTSWTTTIEGGKGKGRNSQVPAGTCLGSGPIDVDLMVVRKR